MVIRLNKQRDTIRWITISRYAFYHIIMQKFIALPSMSIPQTVQIHCSMRGSGKREGHDDVIKWKHFPRYWPFVRVIHRWPGNSPHKGQWRGALMFSLVCAWKKRLRKQSWDWWFETPSRTSWRHFSVFYWNSLCMHGLIRAKIYVSPCSTAI